MSRGIASAVTVLADSASLADAAATAVANASYVHDDLVVQLPAEHIDPNTDLRGIPVTVGVGDLPASVRNTAIEQARTRAEQLSKEKVITGAIVVVDDLFVISAGLKPFAQEAATQLAQPEI